MFVARVNELFYVCSLECSCSDNHSKMLLWPASIVRQCAFEETFNTADEKHFSCGAVESFLKVLIHVNADGDDRKLQLTCLKQ